MTTLDKINKTLYAMRINECADDGCSVCQKYARLVAALRYAVNELCTERDEDHILSILKGETE